MVQAKVLVVEDEVIVAKTIASQLSQLGYLVIGTVSSGMAAIATARETHPDLVLMDIVLHGDIDGITAAVQIREQLDIPIIYLTAYADDNTLERAKVTHPFGYIVKPFTSNELRVTLEIGLFKHQLEREMRENRDQLATLLRSMSDAVIATNNRGVITFMNPAAEALTGWQQEDALGKEAAEIFQVINEVTEQPIENPVSIVLREQQVVYLDAFSALVSKDGTRIPIGDSASPLRRYPDEVSGVVIVFWDISERRQTELLQRALEKEQELNQLKSQFVSTVSHEFRNPLAVIRTATELLELQGANITDLKRREYLRRIKTSIQTMNQLMEDVLFMGRAEAGRLTCTPVPLQLDQFCRDIIEEFSATEEETHHIVLTCQGRCTNVSLDEKLLRYSLTNLLANAIKYSPPGSTIEFDLVCNPDEQLVIFHIRDQGIGIPAAEQGRLFESFYRASNVGSVQGTGLGLAIVKKCMDAHGGQIHVSSQTGAGTTFTLMFPLRDASPS